jgi:hypothetical protein
LQVGDCEPVRHPAELARGCCLPQVLNQRNLKIASTNVQLLAQKDNLQILTQLDSTNFISTKVQILTQKAPFVVVVWLSIKSLALKFTSTKVQILTQKYFVSIKSLGVSGALGCST